MHGRLSFLLHDQIGLQCTCRLNRLQDGDDARRLQPHLIEPGDEGLQIDPFDQGKATGVLARTDGGLVCHNGFALGEWLCLADAWRLCDTHREISMGDGDAAHLDVTIDDYGARSFINDDTGGGIDIDV